MLTVLALVLPASAWASITFATPQVEQCDGTFSAGSTRQAIPAVHESVQNSSVPGLKTGVQPTNFFSGIRTGLRFEDSYRVDVSSCMTTGLPSFCTGGTSCVVANYRLNEVTSTAAVDQGFLGAYYSINDGNSPPNFDWPVVLIQVDPVIDFNKVGGNWPPAVIASTPTFAVRWSGFVVPPTTGNYTFKVAGDDGVRLYVNSVNLLDSFINQAATFTLTAVPMTAGVPYQIVLEYYENGGGGALVSLQWQSSVAGSVGSCSVTGSMNDIPKQCVSPQLVGQVGRCVYDGAACGGAVAVDNPNSIKPIGVACPATVGALPVAPPAGPTPWATATNQAIPVNASPYSAGNQAFTYAGTAATSPDTISFDGQAQWNVPPSYSMSAWVKPTNCVGAQRIYSQDFGGFVRFRLNGCKIDAEDSREGGAFPGAQGPALSASNWHYVAAVRQNGSFWKYYIDGAPVFQGGAASTTTLQIDPTNAATKAVVGSSGTASEYFQGAIDEFRLWPNVLQDDTIMMEYATNMYKYSVNGGVSFGLSTAPFAGGGNGTTNPVTISPSTSTNNAEYIFVAQTPDGLTTAESAPFTLSVDQTAPAAPAITGQAMATNQIQWTFSSSRLCSDGVANQFKIFETSTNIQINAGGPGNGLPIGQTVFLETLADTTPNVSHCRRGTTVDTWGTSGLGTPTTSYTQAAAPTGLTQTGNTATSVTLQWGTNSNPTYTRYELSMSQNNFTAPTDVSTPVAISANFTGNTYTVTGLTAGSPYFFRVRAYNGRASDFFGGLPTGFSFFSTFTSPNGAVVTGVPRSNTQIDWHWKDVQGVTTYNLFSAGAATPFAVVASPGTPGADVSYSSTGLLTNTLYSLQVQPVNGGGNGPLSPAGNAYTLALPPTAMNVTGVSTNSASYQWDAGAVGPLADPAYTFYEVSVATDPLFAIVVSTLTTQQLTMTVPSLLPSSTYYARVRAYSGGQSTTTFAVSGATVTNTNPDVSVASGPPSAYVPPSGVVGLWQFDEGSGTTAHDASSFGNSGTLTCLNTACVSTPTFVQGPPNLNTAVQLTGQTSSLVLIPDPGIYNFIDAITVGAWVDPTSVFQPNGAGIVAKGVQGSEAFSLDVFGSRYRFLIQAGSFVTAPLPVVPGQWHRVVGVFDGVNTSLYIDGALVAGPSALGGRIAPLCGGVNCPVVVGSRVSATGAYDLGFSGAVDSVLLVHRALSPAEVAADYQGAFVSTMTLPPPNARVRLVLPPNAFGGATVIYASNDPVGHPIKIDGPTMMGGLLNQPTGQALINGSLIEIVPTVGGLAYTLPLGSSATIALPYSDSTQSGIIDGSNPPISVNTLNVYTLDPTVLKWNELPSVVDTVNHVVRANTPHFSVFGLFGATTIGNSIDQVRVYPKPWLIGSRGRFDATNMTFDTLPTNGFVRIFNLTGERVIELPFNSSSAGKVLWSGANFNGQPVASGIYFAYIKNSDNNAMSVVKFAIER